MFLTERMEPTDCMLSQVQAVVSHAIYIPLVIQTQDNLWGFVSKTAMWVELLCQCRARPPPVVLMLSELLSNSQKGSESACTGRQVRLYVWIVKFGINGFHLCLQNWRSIDYCLFGFNKNLANIIYFHLHLPSSLHAFHYSLERWSDRRNS